MRIQLSDHFTYGRLVRFTLPSIVMMIFTSIYSVVDGLFVSNFVGKTAFAAINLIAPLPIILGAIGFMIGSGGNAIVAKTLGEGDRERANRYFSLLVYVLIGAGVVLSAIGIAVMRPVAMWLGAEGQMLEDCVTYGTILLAGNTLFMLQCLFQSFLVTAEKPNLGLGVTIAAGVTNMVLDWLFVGSFGWGVAGAAWATITSQGVGGLLPLFYFAGKNSSLLRLTKTKIDAWVLVRTCTNGSSELMSNISASVVTILYNGQLMRLAGEDGVAAYGVLMYVNFIFIAIFIGYAMGSAPVVSFHYGAQNLTELKSLLKKSTVLLTSAGVVLTVLAFVLAAPLSKIFVGYDADLYAMTLRGFCIYAFSFLLCGFNIFGSAFFTALNDGLVSAIIAFMRTLVFQVLAITTLPWIFGLDGVWFAIIMAELLSLAVTLFFIVIKRKKYHYL